MTPTFTANGKQVLRLGEHYADARTEDAAANIAAALNAWASMRDDRP